MDNMGLFNFIIGSGGRSTVEVANDSIWMTREAKFTGITKELNERANSNSVGILLIAHFSDTLEQLNPIAAADHGQIPVRATIASNLSTDIAVSLSLDESATIDLIVAERHPNRLCTDAAKVSETIKLAACQTVRDYVSRFVKDERGTGSAV